MGNYARLSCRMSDIIFFICNTDITAQFYAWPTPNSSCKYGKNGLKPSWATSHKKYSFWSRIMPLQRSLIDHHVTFPQSTSHLKSNNMSHESSHARCPPSLVLLDHGGRPAEMCAIAPLWRMNDSAATSNSWGTPPWSLGYFICREWSGFGHARALDRLLIY